MTTLVEVIWSAKDRVSMQEIDFYNLVRSMVEDGVIEPHKAGINKTDTHSLVRLFNLMAPIGSARIIQVM